MNRGASPCPHFADPGARVPQAISYGSDTQLEEKGHCHSKIRTHVFLSANGDRSFVEQRTWHVDCVPCSKFSDISGRVTPEYYAVHLE